MITAVTCSIPSSYSNVMILFYINLYPNELGWEVNIRNRKYISSNSIGRNTYKVTKLLVVP